MSTRSRKASKAVAGGDIAPDHPVDQIHINSLPDNILLDIFGCLPVKDLCLIGRVCKRWRRVTLDNKFWRHVDLRPYKLNIGKMWKIIRRHFSHVLLTLRMRGYLDRVGINWNKASISDAMLKDLQERCPRLRELHFCYCNMTGVSVVNIPQTIETLIITDSLIPHGWFKALSGKPLPSLVNLDLSNSTKTSNADLKDLGGHVKLKTLKLNGCYRISEQGLQHIATSFTHLERLEISGCELTDIVCHILGRHLKSLRHLHLSECKGLTSAGFQCLTSGLKSLEWLNVNGCLYSQELVSHLFTRQSLKVLYIQNNHIENDTRDGLCKALPDCDVHF